MTNKKIMLYDEIPKDKIVTISNELSKIGRKQLQQIIIDDFRNYFEEIVVKKLPKFTTTLHPLLDVEDSVVVVEFKGNPFAIEIPICGTARLAKTAEGQIIPIIYLLNTSNITTLNHEKIHICQYLLDQSYPLTETQKTILLKDNADKSIRYLLKHNGKENALEFVINSTCYKTWIELEAQYHTIEYTDIYSLMERAYSSSLSIITLNTAFGILECDNKDVEVVRNRYIAFCDLLKEEVSWLNALCGEQTPSIYELILETDDEWETKQFCAPIEDWMVPEYDDNDEDEDELSNEELLSLSEKILRRTKKERRSRKKITCAK